MNDVMTISKETAANLDNSIDSINKQNEMASSVNDSFITTGKEMNKLQGYVRDISTDMQNIMESNEKIVDSISNLSASSEEIAATTKSSLESSLEIQKEANDFSNSIENMFGLVDRLRNVI